ncbi:hypothetical protein [Rivihabitans pingtungensis]|jgi:hypothetical protein|uniref:hypothetical protein n=1 Tax=Rivihabitans pingtungensis TaxID=1054498 RepID=UPI0023F2624D|nr:hypothetical protein [Rivihabitans pingtungensis]HNX70268.1 hypothetical protein [Rivihabitans pingtungensis]
MVKLLVNQLSKVANATESTAVMRRFLPLGRRSNGHPYAAYKKFCPFFGRILPGLLAEQLAWLSRPIMP